MNLVYCLEQGQVPPSGYQVGGGKGKAEVKRRKRVGRGRGREKRKSEKKISRRKSKKTKATVNGDSAFALLGGAFLPVVFIHWAWEYMPGLMRRREKDKSFILLNYVYLK